MKRLTITLFVYTLFSFSIIYGQDNFTYAQPNETWIIMSDGVPVMRTPKSYPTSEEIILNMVGIINKNTKVKVLDTQGFVEVWKKVLYTTTDGNTVVGWVMTSIVRSARKSTDSNSKKVSYSKAGNWGVIRYTHSTVNVRSSRNKSSKIVSKLKPNEKVLADFLENNWYAVFDIDEIFRRESNAIGYVNSTLLYPRPKSKSKKIDTLNNFLSYKIIKREDQSYRGTSRMTYRVLLNVKIIPQEQKIKDVAISIWQDSNKSWDEFTVFLYLPEMNINSFAYGVANFTPTGIKNFSIQEYALSDTKWEK